MATAVNDNGQAVVNFNNRAYLWTLPGELTDLGDLGGGKSYGYAINNLGQIVGASYIDDTTSHAFLWDGQMHDLASLNGGIFSQAGSINNQGVVIGYNFTEGKDFLSRSYGPRPAGSNPLTWSGYPNTIKDDGRMVGEKNSHAWLWTAPGAGTDLGGLTGFYIPMATTLIKMVRWWGRPTPIRSNGPHPCLLLDRGRRNQGPGHRGPKQRAFGINNQGYMVGWSDFQGDYLFTRGALCTPAVNCSISIPW